MSAEEARDRVAEIMEALGEEVIINYNPQRENVAHYTVKMPGLGRGQAVFYVVYGGKGVEYGKPVLLFHMSKRRNLEDLSSDLGIDVKRSQVWGGWWNPDTCMVEVQTQDFLDMTNSEQTRFVEFVIGNRRSLRGKLYFEKR